MSIDEALSIIFGFLTPFIVSYLKDRSWSFTRKVGLVWVISFFFGIISVFAKHQIEMASITLEDVLKNLAIVIATSQTFYSMLYEKIFERKE